MRISRVEGRFRPDADEKSAESLLGMVATAHPEATRAGVEMLEQGGNAIDAACGAGIAIGVCEPQASGLGGQSIGLIHFGGRTFAVDGSSRVPSLSHLDRMSPGDELVGHRATTVPSTLATYAWLHEHYGRLPWRELLAPAIRIAHEGYRITELQHTLLERSRDELLTGSASGARYFLRNGDGVFETGERFTQPALAQVLEVIARDGITPFYQGEIAEQIDRDMRDHDGFLRMDDLALIPWPVERQPLQRRYRGYLVKSMPPPGAGRTLLLVLMTLGNLQSHFLASRTPVRHHFFAEALRKAFLTRIDRPFDANTYHQIPAKTMLSRAYARELALSIADDIDETLPLADPPSQEETTHFSIMDAEGNAVSMTQSIELVYGAKVAADGLGFLYNNYMSALEDEDPSHPYYLRPNAVPWSSAAPSIVFRRSQPWLVTGSPGSERIFSTVGQFLSNVIDRSQTIREAMEEPRLHCSIGGQISLEQERFDPAVPNYLSELGYTLLPREPYAFYLGCIQAVLRRQSAPGFQGVADVRRDGSAAGPSP